MQTGPKPITFTWPEASEVTTPLLSEIVPIFIAPVALSARYWPLNRQNFICISASGYTEKERTFIFAVFMITSELGQEVDDQDFHKAWFIDNTGVKLVPTMMQDTPAIEHR